MTTWYRHRLCGAVLPVAEHLDGDVLWCWCCNTEFNKDQFTTDLTEEQVPE